MNAKKRAGDVDLLTHVHLDHAALSFYGDHAILELIEDVAQDWGHRPARALGCSGRRR